MRNRAVKQTRFPVGLTHLMSKRRTYSLKEVQKSLTYRTQKGWVVSLESLLIAGHGRTYVDAFIDLGETFESILHHGSTGEARRMISSSRPR